MNFDKRKTEAEEKTSEKVIRPMKLQDEAVRYLTRAEVETAREEEHRERVALQERVARGELTPEQANAEAALIKEPGKGRLLNLRKHLDSMARLHPVSYLQTSSKRNVRRRKKTVCSS
jgi:hypothetical protein